MKTMPRECAPPAPTSRKRECVPCDIPPFCRNNYFTGKLLTERDLTAEQRYMTDKLRLHLLALHGWGVVCGLKVKPHPYCPELKLVVEAGLAIDPCGYQILVPHDVEIDLPRPPAPPPKGAEPCPPEPAPSQSATEGSAPAQEGYGQAAQQSPEKPEPPELCGPPSPLYVCLRYAECETEFMPAPFDECACNGDGQKPNRICESYELEVMIEAPKGLDRVKKQMEGCEDGDCAGLYRTMLERCPEPSPIDCIPLVLIRDYTVGQKVTEQMIDNRAVRPTLPSTHLLDQLIRCILDKLPLGGLTRITDTNWTPEGEYHCHDFINFFIGDAQSPKALEVTLERPVYADRLSPRTFRAEVVRHGDKTSEGGYVEVAPARVWASQDRTRFFLRIDPVYAERCLRNIAFDLYVTLECNVFPDEAGHAVDGDLLARVASDGSYVLALPTGDGIEGGAFRTSIRVRP